MSTGKGTHRRSRLDAFAHSSDEEDARESVSSFSRRSAAEERRPPPPPRVIPLASNVDWREDRRRRIGARTNIQELGPLVSMRRADQNGASSSSAPVADVDKIDSEGQKRGLEFRSRPKADTPTEPVAEAPAPPPEESAPAEDGDQEAIKALLAGQGIGNGNGASTQHLVIPQLDETQVLQNDIDTRPDAPTLDDYAAVPIEQFGMAMLRGMGWSEGKGKGPHVAAEPKKRASLLGLGAKERQLPPSSSRSSHQKRDYRYTPVTKAPDRRDDRRDERRDEPRSSSRDDDRHHRKHARRDRSASPPRSRHHRR